MGTRILLKQLSGALGLSHLLQELARCLSHRGSNIKTWSHQLHYNKQCCSQRFDFDGLINVHALVVAISFMKKVI